MIFSAQLAERFISPGQNVVCVRVWLLASGAQMVTAAHRDL